MVIKTSIIVYGDDNNEILKKSMQKIWLPPLFYRKELVYMNKRKTSKH